MKEPGFVSFCHKEVGSVCIEKASAVVLPVCYENAPSFGKGSRDGALHILQASLELEPIDEETLSAWAPFGVHTLDPLVPRGGPEEAVNEIKSAAKRVLAKKKRLLTLGGDHAVSIGSIAAAADRYPALGVLQVDAHPDLRDSWNGSRFNHACVMRRVVDDMGLFSVSVGIRTLCREELDLIRERNLKVFFSHDICRSDGGWIYRVVDLLPKQVYLTIDLDGLDPAVLPATGTPVPGGLSFRQLAGLIRELGAKRSVVAADIVELSKIPCSMVSEFTAAKIAQKIFAFCWARESR